MSKLIQLSFGLLLLMAFFLALCLPISAQTEQQRLPATSANADKGSPNIDEQVPSDLDYELRAKRALKYAEKEHQENLSRAREASDLSNGLAAAFKRKHSLNSEDLKKLDKLEKVTKKIRTELGASDEEFILERKPTDLRDAVESLAKVSSSLSERVMKTPRRVVSTTLIEEANVLLELIRIVRNFAR